VPGDCEVVTVEEHRQAVRVATMDAAVRLVAQRGLASVTMSAIAEEAGLGRATLYKYFPDVQAILTAWHERQVSDHLEHLTRVRDQDGAPGQRLKAVLTAYALRTWERPHGTELAALLQPELVRSATTCRLMSWRVSACMPSPPPAACHPGQPSSDWST